MSDGVRAGRRSGLETLECLDLAGNGLRALDDSVCDLPALTSLKLDDNQLERLPDSIGRLTALTRSSLVGSPVAPDEFKRLKAALPIRANRKDGRLREDSFRSE